MRKCNYPQTQLDEIEPSAVQIIVSSLSDLHQLGRPKTDQEVAKRIDEYFAFCQASALRPGIESLCLALCITRTTLFQWAKGVQCSPERQEMIINAKSFIGSFIEQAMLSGKINPASGIFLMKNWLGYKDTVSLEEVAPEEPVKKLLTAADLPILTLDDEDCQ